MDSSSYLYYILHKKSDKLLLSPGVSGPLSLYKVNETSTGSLFLSFILWSKEPGCPRGMAGVGKIQDETETSLAPESKEVLKKKKKRRGRGMSVAQKSQPERVPCLCSHHIHFALTLRNSREKREPSYTLSGDVNWCSLYGELYGCCSKTKNRIAIRSSNPWHISG